MGELGATSSWFSQTCFWQVYQSFKTYASYWMAGWDVCGEAVWVLSASAGGRRHICLCGDGIISSHGNQSALLLSAVFPFFFSFFYCPPVSSPFFLSPFTFPSHFLCPLLSASLLWCDCE